MATVALRQQCASPCRFCGAPLERSFIDLGRQPPSNRYLRPADFHRREPVFPLHAYVCTSCLLVQLESFQSPAEIFSDYAYFSSYSASWLRHAEVYCETMIKRFGFGRHSQVIEVASNDGYLLQYFARFGVPVLGIEPAANVAQAARSKGVPTRVGFFGEAMARTLVDEGRAADLLLGNNVLAHVPDLNDFVAGLRIALKPDGILTMEFPHLLRLIEGNQFDTIYHEHFSYFSFMTAERIFAAHGIVLFDVEELPTHGGSLRIYGCRAESGRPPLDRVGALKEREKAAGLNTIAAYDGFGDRAASVRDLLLSFLREARKSGKSVAAFGAAAKGNTLLNYCGVGPAEIEYVADSNPHKQGHCLPGSHIPIVAPARIAETRPDYLLVLPWNLTSEIINANAHIRNWGGRFVIPIPKLAIIE